MEENIFQKRYAAPIVRGTDNLIHYVGLNIHLFNELDEHSVNVFLTFDDGLPSDITYQELIDKCIIREEVINTLDDAIERLKQRNKYPKKYTELETVNEINRIAPMYFKFALIESGFWDTINDYISNENTSIKHKIYFENADYWCCNDEIFKHLMSNVLNLTENEIKELFSESYKILKQHNCRSICVNGTALNNR